MKETPQNSGIFIPHTLLTHFMNSDPEKTNADAFTLFIHYIQMLHYRNSDRDNCIFYTVTETINNLGWTKPRITKARKVLKDFGLIKVVIKTGGKDVPHSHATSHIWINSFYYNEVKRMRVVDHAK